MKRHQRHIWQSLKFKQQVALRLSLQEVLLVMAVPAVVRVAMVVVVVAVMVVAMVVVMAVVVASRDAREVPPPWLILSLTH